MQGREVPGEFEQVVLLTVARLEDEAYGMAIRQEIADRTGRDVGIGSVYSALDRMEAKGFVSSTLGGGLGGETETVSSFSFFGAFPPIR